MKRITAILLTICLIVSCSAALAATTASVTESRISTRSGPSTKYTEPGSFLWRGAQVTVHTRSYDSRNGIYWVQVEFTSGNERYRAYTGAWRLNVDLSWVPDEIVLQDTAWLTGNTCGYAGPGYDFHYYDDIVVYSAYPVKIIEVENNFALIETEGSSAGLTRIWVPLSRIYGGDAYWGQDTFGSGWDDDQGATLISDDDYMYADYPIGRTCVVWVESGNARYGAGTQYDFARYVHEGEVLTILDSRVGSTGKDWYKVNIDGTICWLSSGLVTLDGNSEGTINGVPIIPEEASGYKRYMVGKWFWVNSESAHVRAQADTVSPTVEYVTRYERYEILDVCVGSTGKDWYRIRVDGTYGWISSGLVVVMD